MRESNIPTPVDADTTLPMTLPRPERGPVARPDDLPYVDAAGATHRGRLRPTNEDNFVVCELYRWLQVRDTSLEPTPGARPPGACQGWLLAVADGMGGHPGGGLASAVVIDTLLEHVCHQMPWTQADDRSIDHEIAATCTRLQSRLTDVARRKQLDGPMPPGTTLTVAYLTWPTLHLLHVGDSRCYLVRDGALHQLTRDHTAAQSLIDGGMDPQSIAARLDHVLSNAICAGDEPCRPDVSRHPLRPGDGLLLCSDGISGQLDQRTVQETLSTATTARQACRRLVQASCAAGGRDNATALVAFCRELS